MQLVTKENEAQYREMVLLRDYLADPALGPDPLTVISKDTVAAQVLRALCDVRQQAGDEAYRAALLAMPAKLHSLSDRLTMAIAHQRRVDAGEELE